MSGHSKWATTHRQKSAADAKRGAIFTKLANLITIAAKEGGTDPNSNFKLRLAIDKAKTANVPKDNIERAISRGAGSSGGGNSFEELTYEIFGPANSAFLVEAVTDNKNRTVAEVKTTANKNGGQLGGPNSVSWMFERKGFATINLEGSNLDKDQLELDLIDAGAQEIDKDNKNWEIISNPEDLQNILQKIKLLEISITDSGLGYFAKNDLKISSIEEQNKIQSFYDLLDDIGDVTNVYTNATW